MHSWRPAFTGLCLILNACSGGTNAGGSETAPSGGSAGTDDSTQVGGNAEGGGTFGVGGAPAVAGTGGAGADTFGGTSAGGTNAIGGGGTTAETGGAGGQGGATPWKIDFSTWELQLPTGSGNSPTIVLPAKLLSGYMDAYFYPLADGQAFMDPATGITTNGSTHCRTELREFSADGKSVTWKASATNVMTVNGKVLKLGAGASGNTTVAQIFNDSDSITLMELQYSASKGGFALFYEESKGGGAPPTDLKTKVAIGEPYSFSLSLSKGVAAVSINGKQVFTQIPSPGTVGANFYFKLGNYDQNSSAGTPSTTPYTIVEVSRVDVVHQ